MTLDELSRYHKEKLEEKKLPIKEGEPLFLTESLCTMKTHLFYSYPEIGADSVRAEGEVEELKGEKH